MHTRSLPAKAGNDGYAGTLSATKKKKMKKWIYRISILLNIVFLLGYLLNWFNSPSYEIGRLEEDVKVGIFTGDSTIFKIPKGLTVRNVSERGIGAIGQFENNRFYFLLKSSEETFLRYLLSILL